MESGNGTNAHEASYAPLPLYSQFDHHAASPITVFLPATTTFPLRCEALSTLRGEQVVDLDEYVEEHLVQLTIVAATEGSTDAVRTSRLPSELCLDGGNQGVSQPLNAPLELISKQKPCARW